MKQIPYEEFYKSNEQLAKDAILNEAHTGFKEDYLTLHILLKKYGNRINRFFEIGTNIGEGTQIIKNALPECDVLTLDLPIELAHKSLQHPVNEGKGDRVGSACKLPYTQLRGDSMTYDYSKHYPIDGWFIDGEHDYSHPRHESIEAIKSKAKLIIWHDSDIPWVNNAISDSFDWNKDYELFRVTGTRIAYAMRNKI